MSTKGTKEMQPRHHRQSTYQRPNMNWQCGRLSACEYGPNGNGRCSHQDKPCVPKRTLRAKKKRIALTLFVLALIGVGLLLTLDGMLARISPGPLSASHAEVASCQDCHSAANLSLADWVKNVVMQGGHNDDTLCLDCHSLGDNAFLPHSTNIVSNEQYLNAKTIQAQTNIDVKSDAINFNSSTSWITKAADTLYSWQSGQNKNNLDQSDPEQKSSDQKMEVSCSVCHREHNKETSDLTEFEADKCHTCHEVKFDSIDHGHPEFSQFPHVQTTNIRFDHVTHLNNYFYDDEHFDTAPTGCTSCHATDQTGEWMLSSSFEETCSSCHLNDIMGSNRATEKGVVVLSVPELDLESLQKAGLNIGQWPAWADGELSPFMQVLLPGYQAQVFKGISLFDLTAASDEQLKAVAYLAWDIKKLFYEIQVGGTAVINRRLSEAYQQSIDSVTSGRLIAALPRDTLVNNQLEWFPDLMDEMQRYQQGLIGISSDLSDASPSPKNREQEALGQEVVNEEAIISEELLEGNGDTIIDELDTGGDEILLDDELILSDDDDNDDELLLNDDELSLNEDGDELLLDDDELSLSDDDEEEDSDESTPIITAASPEEWAVTGGWYRDGSSIRYRPIGHADPFFKTWLDISAHDDAGISQRIFSTLNQSDSVGNCLMCHGSNGQSSEVHVYREQSAEGSGSKGQSDQLSTKIHWLSFEPSDITVDFNRFSHVSHFSLMTDDGCSSCHLISSSDGSNASSDSDEETENIFTSGFEDMPQTTCTQCHQPGRAPDDCLTCHNYHAERQLPAIEQINDVLRQEGVQ